MEILQRDKSGEPVSPLDPDYPVISGMLKEAARIIFELNSSFHDEAEIRALFSRLTGTEMDETFIVRPPFYADFGRNIRVGKNVFINHGCTVMDRGGITLEDDVLIAPKVNLVTLNHMENPAQRRSTVCAPITVQRNGWIGLGATIMPGVTVGENAIVAASALVTRDVPPDTIVAGIPAKIVRSVNSEYARQLQITQGSNMIRTFVMIFMIALLVSPMLAQAADGNNEKVLVIYFSLSGRTKAVAERLQSKTGADIFEIQTAKTYPSTYPGVYDEPKRELEENDLPELRSGPPDMSSYDLILVGAPVWWYTVPTPLMKFLQDANFAGKRVASFCTYDTTLGQYHPHFAQQAKNADVREGISLSYPHRIPEPELNERLDAWLRAVRDN